MSDFDDVERFSGTLGTSIDDVDGLVAGSISHGYVEIAKDDETDE